MIHPTFRCWACIGVLLLAGCATTQKPPEPVPAPAPKPEPKIIKTKDAQSAEAIEQTFKQRLLTTKLELESIKQDNGDTMIAYKRLVVTIPVDKEQATRLARELGAFAATRNRPVSLTIQVKNKNEDKIMTAAVKNGAIGSGGENSVILDHHIGPTLEPQLSVIYR